jgi:hypothetical protein
MILFMAVITMEINGNESDQKCVKIEHSDNYVNGVTTKMSNKFSIESILGLDDDDDNRAKSNRLEAADCQKGNFSDCELCFVSSIDVVYCRIKCVKFNYIVHYNFTPQMNYRRHCQYTTHIIDSNSSSIMSPICSTAIGLMQILIFKV